MELLTDSAKNLFLKRRLDTNLCQVLIDGKCTRDWQLDLMEDFIFCVLIWASK